MSVAGTMCRKGCPREAGPELGAPRDGVHPLHRQEMRPQSAGKDYKQEGRR